MKKLLLMFGIVSCWISLSGQGTISTHGTYPDNNGSSAVSFEVESTSPINITAITNVFNTATTSSDVWIRMGGVGNANASNDLEVTAANGWTLYQTTTVSGGGGANSQPVPLQGLNPISIPANTPVGIVITGSMRYSGSGSTPLTPSSFVNGPVTLRAGGTNPNPYGHGGAMPTLTNQPRGFIGSITYELGITGSCPAFTNFGFDTITPNGAVLNWTPGTGNSSFYLEYGPAGFNPGSGTKITGTYPGAQPPVNISGLVPETNYDFYFGEICNSGSDSIYFGGVQSFTTTPLCPLPSSVNVLYTTSNSAVVALSSSGNEFDVEWGPVGFMQGTGCIGNYTSSNGMITLQNSASPGCSTPLSPNTSYEFYIRSDCSAQGKGVSGSWDGPYLFTTQCAGLTSPYFNNFDNNPLDVPPVCWNGVATGTSSFVEVEDFTGTAAPYSAPRALYLYSGSSSTTPGADTVAAISPQFTDLTASDKRIRFFANSDGANSKLIIGTISGLSASAVFTPMDTITFMVPDTYEEVIINFDAANGYNGSDQYIVLMHSLGSTFQYVRIDDFNYEMIPSCPGSSSTTLNAVAGAQDANAYWSGGQGDTTEVVWGVVGFTPASTGQLGSGWVSGADTTFLITGLNPQTTYEFYIRDSCTIGGNGVYIGPFAFTTTCLPVVAPYSEDFEGHTLGFYDGTDNCWTIEHSAAITTVTSAYTWELRNTAQTSSGTTTGANHDNTLAPATGGKFFNADVSYGSGQTTSLVSPLVDVSNLNNPYLEYHIHRYGSVMAQLHVDVFDGTQWINSVHSYTNPLGAQTSQSDAYQDTLLDLAPYVSANNTVRVRFRAVNGGCCAGDNSLDDINFIEGPTCTPPTQLGVKHLTSTSATATWFNDPSALGYQVWYGPQGFYQGSQTTGGTMVNTTADSLNISGLSPNTCYEFAMRKVCAPGDTSEWVGAYGFCTFCASQLSGVYTVGGPAGPNNFPTLDTVIQLLNDCGIGGPVTINLSGGIHNSFVLNDVVNTSAVNTITINGSASGDSILGSGGAIQLNGTDYISFNNLFIKSNTGYTVWMHNDAHHISFDNCTIESNRTTTSSANNVMIASGSNTSPSTSGLNAYQISVTNSTIAGGYYGISIYNVSSTSHVPGLTVSNCNFEDIYYYGLRSYYNDSVQILDNHFEPFRNTTSGYGVYLYYNDEVTMTGNEIEWVGTYSLYSYYTNNTGTGTSLIANNLMNSSGTYGVYMYSNNKLDFFHNTVNGGTHGMYLGGSTASAYANLDFRNNIFTANGTGRALWIATTPVGAYTLNYNLYHNYVGNEIAYHNGTAYTSLAAWQTAEPNYNANSVTGDPVYISMADNLRVLGSAANDVGDNSVGITVDVDGDTRPASGSTVVDMGADEFTPLAGDLEVLSGEFIKGQCLSTNDSIAISIYNLIGSAVDFSVNPLLVTYAANGPVSTSGTILVNSGTLAAQDTIWVYDNGINLSIPGTYVLNAYIDPNAVNVLALNDTLAKPGEIIVRPEFNVNPKVTILPSANDSVEVCVESSFFGGGSFFISEVCHYAGFGTGAGVVPAYLIADDYIEITGRPGEDLDGFTLEQWSTSAIMSTHTFGPGTVMGPNGTAIIAVGQLGASVPSPSNYYYHGNGAYTGTFSSGGSNGRILKDPSGNIVDAVGYNTSFTFPAASGVTAADWSGNTGSTSGTAGIRLMGPDNNSAADWSVVSASLTQDANVLNANVSLPAPASAPGFTWSYNGTVIDTVPCTVFGPYTAGGTYQYVANFSNACGTYADTVTVIVPNCSAPSNLIGSALSTSSVSVSWDTTGTGATDFHIEYGPAGFTPGSGTRITITGNSTTLTGLANNLCQDYYVRASCSAVDTSAWIGPVNICPEANTCDDFEAYNAGGILGQSALIKGWYATTTGAVAVSTTRSVSGTKSLYIPGDGVSDVVAWYDTINTGTWNFQMQIFVPTGTEAYYNFQRNYTHGDPTQTNAWAFDVNYLASGTATIDGGSYGPTGVASFTYNPGQWNLVEHIIDFDNDSAWIMVNGANTGAGWVYSFNNFTVPVQNNAINFYSNPNLTNPDYYVDDFCVVPYVPAGGCTDPTALNSSNIGCADAIVSWTSGTAMASSVVIYGPTGFNPASGGTTVTTTGSTLVITGLTPGAVYDYYVMDICTNGDSSAMIGPDNFTTLSGPISASFIPSLGAATAVNLLATFDASASVGASTYSWDFGDGSTTTTTSANATHSYNLNGNYTVCLTVNGDCGMDSICDTIQIRGIDLLENALSQSLQVYPNPASSKVKVSFDVQKNGNTTLRLLDLSGKAVMLQQEQAVGSRFEVSLDISTLAKGVYMLEVENGDSKAIRRIIVD